MKKRGMLCEDANGLEVTDEKGQDRIVKTNDRKELAERLEGGKIQPTHESDKRRFTDSGNP